MSSDYSIGNESSSSNEGDSIKVFVRIRPPDSYGQDAGHHKAVTTDETGKAIIVQCKPEPKIYTFDQVVRTDATQDSVFAVIGRRIIEACVNGYNGTIFAYGQTGSGKTFTMLGPSEDADNFQHELRGVIPRAFEYLFNLINREQELHGKAKEFLLKCSFLEIYHEQVFDLLEPSAMCLHLRESIKKGVYVDGLAEIVVTSASEAYGVLNNGWINRRVASTSMNRESSRSHAVFSINIESKEMKAGVEKVRHSVLNLVDLAGSERQKDSKAVGQRLKEAGSINKSLSVLGNCIMSLVDIAHGKSRHIPYRDSKLTFLLRDSLGGNAKTHIIACIHADSKCFGETLSTLHFARRAKMIKNKAVINEDAHGNVMALQQEIKKLKEIIKNQGISKDPSASGGENVQEVRNTMSDSEWRHRFVDAMLFHEKSEADKMTLQESITKLQDICEKKDRFLQSTKMIIKFRETNVKRLEKMVKEKGYDESQTNQLVCDLQEEVAALKEQVDKHPMVAKYAMDIHRLKADLKQYRNDVNRVEDAHSSQLKMEELESLYTQLVSQKDSNPGDLETPSKTPTTSDAVSTATLEKHKSQVTSLQEEISELKKSLTETRETAEKKNLELESELTSHKKTVVELNTVLEAQQIKSKLERDSHLQTVKVMTTPTKAKYILRNRMIPSTDSATASPDLNTSIPFEDDSEGILDEKQPQLLIEHCNDALREELNQQKEEINSLQQRIDEYECDSIKLKQHISKIDHQNAHLNEILDRERSTHSTQGGELEKEIRILKEQFQAAEKNVQMFQRETSDFKMVLASSDKELRDLKAEKKAAEIIHQQSVSELETKIMQIDISVSNITRENEELVEERDNLLEEIENSRENASYQESLVTELDDELKEEKKKLKDSLKQIEFLNQNLNGEKERHEQLLMQTQSKGEVQEQEMIQIAQERDRLHEDLRSERDKADEQAKEILAVEDRLKASEHKLSSLHRQQEENKEAVVGYMQKIEDLMKNVRSLEDCLKESGEETLNLKSVVDEQTAQMEGQRSAYEELQRKVTQQADAHNVEYCLIKEDLDCTNETYDRLQEEFRTTQKLLENTQDENECLAVDVKELNEKIKKADEENCQKVAEMELKLKEAEERLYTEKTEQDQFNMVLEENDRLKKASNTLNRIIGDYENGRQEKCNEIKCLKEKLSSMEADRAQLEQSEAQHSELETRNSSLEEKICELQSRIESIQTQFTTTKEDLSSQERLHQRAEAGKSLLEAQLLEMTNQVQEKVILEQQHQEEVERLMTLAKKYNHEREEHAEQIKMHMTEREKTYKEMAELNLKLDQVNEENAKMVGHNNHKQRIQKHMELKEENNHLREQLIKIQKAYKELEMKQGSNLLRTQSESTLKENTQPRKAMDLHRGARNPLDSPRMFLSGDYT